jgi:transposase
MMISIRDPHDLTELDRLIRRERNAKKRDRYRAVRLALDGHTAAEIMGKLDRSKNFVQRWCYIYRDQGLDALCEKPRSGQPAKLPRDQERAFIELLSVWARDADIDCPLQVKDVLRILTKEFGVKYSLSGVRDLLHRLGLGSLQSRAFYRRMDSVHDELWQSSSPLLSKKTDK